MDEITRMSASLRRRRERRIWRGGLVLSAVVHALVFTLWRSPLLIPEDAAAAGPAEAGERAAAGGLQALNLAFPETPPITPPPVPIAVVAEVDPVEFDDVPRVDPASLLGEVPGLDDGPGLEEGTGEGNAGDAESGAGGLRPPAPQGMIIPPTHRDLRGSEVQVWVFVDARGRVVPDSTRLEPPTRNGDFNERLIREASEWIFRPATRDGTPVAAWFPYRIIM